MNDQETIYTHVLLLHGPARFFHDDGYMPHRKAVVALLVKAGVHEGGCYSDYRAWCERHAANT